MGRSSGGGVFFLFVDVVGLVVVFLRAEGGLTLPLGVSSVLVVLCQDSLWWFVLGFGPCCMACIFLFVWCFVGVLPLALRCVVHCAFFFVGVFFCFFCFHLPVSRRHSVSAFCGLCPVSCHRGSSRSGFARFARVTLRAPCAVPRSFPRLFLPLPPFSCPTVQVFLHFLPPSTPVCSFARTPRLRSVIGSPHPGSRHYAPLQHLIVVIGAWPLAFPELLRKSSRDFEPCCALVFLSFLEYCLLDFARIKSLEV